MEEIFNKLFNWLYFYYQYNNFENYFSVDEVFIILIIPAIDMLRLFIVRILNKTHPLKVI